MLGAHPRGPPRASLLKPPAAQPGAALAVTASRYFVGSRVCVLKTNAVRTVASPHRAARSQARASEAVSHPRRRRVEKGVLATVTVGSVCDTRVAHGSPACSCWCRQRPERSSLPEAVGTSLSPVAGPGAPNARGGAAPGGVSPWSARAAGETHRRATPWTRTSLAPAQPSAHAPPRHLPQVREQAGGGRAGACRAHSRRGRLPGGAPSATDSAPARLAGCVCARLSFQDSEEAEGEGGVAGPRGGCGWVPCCVPATRPAARGCGQRGARRCPPWSPPSLSGRARVSQRLAGEGLRGSDDSAACSWCGADGSLLHWLPSLCCCPDVGCPGCAGVRWPVKGWEHTARL